MQLRGQNNTYLDFTKKYDFHIQWLGFDTTGEKWMVDMYFRWVGWGWKLTTNDLAIWVQEALWILVFDREVDLWIVDSLENLTKKASIIWDVADFWNEEWLMMERLWAWVLRIWLYAHDKNRTTPKRKEIYFDVENEGMSNTQIPRGDIRVVSTQRQFAQLVNLALAIQEYNLKWWK